VSHCVTVFADDDHLATRVAPFIKEGLERRQAVVAVSDERKLALLDETLGPAGGDLRKVDRDGFYTRPEAALADYDRQVRRLLREGFASVRLFGELPLCGSPDEVDAWIAYEAILNRAFEHRPVSILCGYDTREQPDALVEATARTHPHVLGEDGPNGHYHDPGEIVRLHTPPAESPPGLRTFEVGDDPAAFRRRLLAELAAEGVPEAEAQGLVVAVGEVVANARRHGDGIREMRIGRAGDCFVCEVSDRGPGIADPIAGYIPPTPDGPAGGGLWVARQLTRRLELISNRTGLTARLWVRAVTG
jgi:anti-sigma regulatory factor (Ser/Thr protein kinase)